MSNTAEYTQMKYQQNEGTPTKMNSATLKKTVTEEKIFQRSDERWISIMNFLEAVRKNSSYFLCLKTQSFVIISSEFKVGPGPFIVMKSRRRAVYLQSPTQFKCSHLKNLIYLCLDFKVPCLLFSRFLS